MPIELAKFGNESLDAIRSTLADILQENGAPLLEGAQEDVRLYVEAISRDMVEHLKVPDAAKRQALLDELQAQIEFLPEFSRIRAEKAKMAAFQKLVGTVGRVAVSFVTHLPVDELVSNLVKGVKP